MLVVRLGLILNKMTKSTIIYCRTIRDAKLASTSPMNLQGPREGHFISLSGTTKVHYVHHVTHLVTVTTRIDEHVQGMSGGSQIHRGLTYLQRVFKILLP